MTLGQQVRKMREELELTQRQLAFRTNLAPSTISNIEKDKVRPHLHILDALAKVLKFKVVFYLEPLNETANTAANRKCVIGSEVRPS